MRYNSDEEFKSNVQELYDREVCQLSILDIYALEEILRYGTKGIFSKFLEVRGSYTEEQAIYLFEQFRKLLQEDINFKQYKIQQLVNYPETVSEMEKFVFNLIGKSEQERESLHEDMTDELEYDPLTPILYSTDNQIRETLENLLFGEFVHHMLELPNMKPVKARQRRNGMIASFDKPFVIEQIRNSMTPEIIEQFKQTIDNRFIKVKFNVLLGKEVAFGDYLEYNTNIYASEVLGIYKDIEEQEAYEIFKDVIDNLKNSKRPFTK